MRHLCVRIATLRIRALRAATEVAAEASSLYLWVLAEVVVALAVALVVEVSVAVASAVAVAVRVGNQMIYRM
jgi:hypothetical protein